MWTIIIEILKALFSGEIKRLWAEHKVKEADNAVNRDNAASGDDAQRMLDRWRR